MSEGEPEDGEESHARMTRRQILAAAGGVAGAASIAAGATSNGDNHIAGGDMALDEAGKVSGKLWMGPEAGRTDVEPKVRRVYMASDTQVQYYGDGDSWTKMGIGSDQEPVPSVSTEEANIGSTLTFQNTDYAGAFDLGTMFTPITDDGDLDTALTNQTDGQTFRLAQSAFSSDRTFTARTSFQGSAVLGYDGTYIDGAQLTFQSRSNIGNFFIEDGAITIEQGPTFVSDIHGTGADVEEIVVNTSACTITRLNNIDVTFASGTSGNVIDSCTRCTVTDNGTNNVGDVF